MSDLDYFVDCLLTRHKIVRSDKKAIEVSQIQQLLRQTVLRQKATLSEEELAGGPPKEREQAEEDEFSDVEKDLDEDEK